MTREIPASLQAQIDSFAAQRARLGAKRAPVGPKSPEKAENGRFGRPVQVGEALWHWWADPDR